MEIFGSYDNVNENSNVVNLLKDDPKYDIVYNHMCKIHKNLFISNNNVINSKDIADILKMEHYNLLVLIDTTIERFKDLDSKINKHFKESVYKTKQNKDMRCFDISEFGYIMLTMFMGNYDLILYKEAMVRLYSEYDNRAFMSFERYEYVDEMITSKRILDLNEYNFKFSLIDEKVLVVSSLELAKVFNKEHFHILQIIRDILENCSKNFGALNCGFTIRKWSQEMPNGGIGEHDEPIYYVTRNMFVLIIATFRSTNDEIIKLKYDFIILFDKIINYLNKLKTGEIPIDILSFSDYIEERAKFNKTFTSISNFVLNEDKYWDAYCKTYNGLENEFEEFWLNNCIKKNKNSIVVSKIYTDLYYMDPECLKKNPSCYLLNQYLQYIGVLENDVVNNGLNRGPHKRFIDLGLFDVKHSKMSHPFDSDETHEFYYATVTKKGAKLLFMLRGAFAEWFIVKHFDMNSNLPLLEHNFYTKYQIQVDVTYKKLGVKARLR